jgi:hypothetical protein
VTSAVFASGRPSGTAQGECGSTRSMEWGVGPGGGVPHRGAVRQGNRPPGTSRKARCRGRSALRGGSHDRDPELVARAQRAATHLESAWEQWRALDGLPQVSLQQVPLQSGPFQSGPLQQVKLTGSASEGTGEYPSSAHWARQYISAAAASQRIRPGIWPAGPRVSFPAR